jgi:SAM-dependent methyltransferase
VVLSRLDWAGWWQRFEDQQTFHIPRREQRFVLMLELVAEVTGGAPRAILDLACGTGAISARAAPRFPDARLVALDVDPLLLAIGQHTLGDFDGRLSWLRSDLRGAGWADALRPFAPFDAVLTSTALHWLAAPDLVRLYRGLAELIAPGGILLNAEHLLVSPRSRPLAELTERLRQRLSAAGEAESAQAHGSAESWAAWWQAARAEPGFAALLAERERVFPATDHAPHEHIDAPFHQAALALAGFAESAVVWRYLDDTLLAAVR